MATSVPLAVSPLARCPLTVTLAMPPSPRPASVAVPLKVTVPFGSVCPLAGLLTLRFGPNSSAPPPALSKTLVVTAPFTFGSVATLVFQPPSSV